MAEAAGEAGVRSGMVVVPQAFGNSVNMHPHVHAIASRGGWTKDETWVAVPYVDAGAAARLFRHKVLRLLPDAEFVDERSWSRPTTATGSSGWRGSANLAGPRSVLPSSTL